MRFMHLSDLHIGKRVNEFSMIEDQKYILKQILHIIDDYTPHCVLIAGDIYDKAVPSAEAVELFDDFLYHLAVRNLKVFVISGNHDSPERIAFGARIMKNSSIFLSPVYNGSVEAVSLTDEWGIIRIFPLPFIKPVHVKRFFPDDEINNYNDALQTVIRNMDIDSAQRNVLLTHQFITGAQRSDSEDISVGGSDNIDAAAFEAFDYVALGHLHTGQHVLRETIRYCGSPLKYSFSESTHTKSVTLVELKEKGTVHIQEAALFPQKDMRQIRGSYMEVTAKSFYKESNPDDYLQVTLTDEEEIPEAIGKLRAVYPNIMKLDYDNKRTKASGIILPDEEIVRKNPLEMFCDFYEMQNGQAPDEQQHHFIKELIGQIWGDAE